MPPVLIKTTAVKLFDQIPSVKSSKGNTSMIDDTDVIRREIIKLNEHKDTWNEYLKDVVFILLIKKQLSNFIKNISKTENKNFSFHRKHKDPLS